MYMYVYLYLSFHNLSIGNFTKQAIIPMIYEKYNKKKNLEISTKRGYTQLTQL